MSSGLTLPPETTVETGRTGILAICECDEQRPRDDLLAAGAGGIDYPVVVRRDGTVTNRYADGTVGVPEDVAEQARADEEPVCPGCSEYVIGWLHHDTPSDE